jgi:hypothetical protein|tara:strand:- start:480 stop:611 length:132 start_codon:yes stop_codon:yes gene_type:complete
LIFDGSKSIYENKGVLERLKDTLWTTDEQVDQSIGSTIFFQRG